MLGIAVDALDGLLGPVVGHHLLQAAQLASESDRSQTTRCKSLVISFFSKDSYGLVDIHI